MKGIKLPVFLTTSVLFFYTLTPHIGVPFSLIYYLFLLLNGMVIWMVYRVLKYGKAPDISFDQQWYEDKPRES